MLLTGAAATAGALALPVGPARAATRRREVGRRVLTTTVVGIGDYVRLPFEVPPGVTRLDVSATKSSDQAALGLGLFDTRGADYQGGFRGIFGEERAEFFVSTSSATEAFVPGPIPPGTWTVLIPVFRAPVPTEVVVTVVMSDGDQGPAYVLPPSPGLVEQGARWYRGDLHCHTPASSDAFSSGSALSPRGWADACRSLGLDFVSLTDHNVISQNDLAVSSAGEGVLLMGGEEMTNWFHGHATVSGIGTGVWFDWRQAPGGAPLPSAARKDDGSVAQIRDFLALARDEGAYVAAAHPAAFQIAWQFQAELLADPASRPDGYEVWTGPFQPDDQAALTQWDRFLQQGIRLTANGGSDLHGVDNSNGFRAGTPTTWVHAEALSPAALVAALRAGRSFTSRTAEGPEVYLSATRPGQRAVVGGTVFGDVGDLVDVQVVVRGAGGSRLLLISGGATVQVVELASDDETVTAQVPVTPGGGYVRAEVRGEVRLDPTNPTAGEMDMDALTNPVFLEVGDPPAGTTPDLTPPVTPAPGGGGGSAGGGATGSGVAGGAPGGTATAGGGGTTTTGASSSGGASGARLAATGAVVAAPAVGVGALAAALLARRRAAAAADEDVPLELRVDELVALLQQPAAARGGVLDGPLAVTGVVVRPDHGGHAGGLLLADSAGRCCGGGWRLPLAGETSGLVVGERATVVGRVEERDGGDALVVDP